MQNTSENPSLYPDKDIYDVPTPPPVDKLARPFLCPDKSIYDVPRNPPVKKSMGSSPNRSPTPFEETLQNTSGNPSLYPDKDIYDVPTTPPVDKLARPFLRPDKSIDDDVPRNLPVTKLVRQSTDPVEPTYATPSNTPSTLPNNTNKTIEEPEEPLYQEIGLSLTPQNIQTNNSPPALPKRRGETTDFQNTPNSKDKPTHHKSSNIVNKTPNNRLKPEEEPANEELSYGLTPQKIKTEHAKKTKEIKRIISQNTRHH